MFERTIILIDIRKHLFNFCLVVRLSLRVASRLLWPISTSFDIYNNSSRFPTLAGSGRRSIALHVFISEGQR